MYAIVTELEKQSTKFEVLEDAIAHAEQTLPASMNWEIRDEDDNDNVVYTHYLNSNE